MTRSDLELDFLELLAAHGLPKPKVNHHVLGHEVDFFWPERRLIVETDGRETHLTRQAFERDRHRDARLKVAGYDVVRFTYRQVLYDAKGTADLLRSLLGAG